MVRPKKPPGEAATDRIDIRATPVERESYLRAAEQAGVSLSEWIKARLNRAAKRESKR